MIALVAVNFSWSACKVLIDVSNVATATVLAIPNQLKKVDEINITCEEKTSEEDKKDKNKINICLPDVKSFLVRMNLAEWKDGKEGGDIIYNPNDETLVKDYFNATKNVGEIKNNQKIKYDNSAVTYLLGLAGTDIVTMSLNQDKIQNVENLTVDALISVVLSIAYFIVFICLFIVLMARLIVIWMVIAFSPLLVLQFALGGKFSITDKMGGVQIFKEFFMPTLVAFPITVGHIMLLA